MRTNDLPTPKTPLANVPRFITDKIKPSMVETQNALDLSEFRSHEGDSEIESEEQEENRIQQEVDELDMDLAEPGYNFDMGVPEEGQILCQSNEPFQELE